jgi:outer membrane protein OmpU
MPLRVRVENGIMHQRLLLGTTALMGASMMFTSAAMAQDGGLEVVLGGFTEFGVSGANGDTLQDRRRNQQYKFYMDSEVHVRVNGLTDGGVRYGSKVELSVDQNNGNATVDEVGLFFSGNFGRVELGRDDGAEDVMFVGAEDAQAGTGGIDGDQANLNNVQFADTGDAVKATYFTPRIAGFQAGFSWTPDGDDNNGNNTFGSSGTGNGQNRKDLAGGGINWVGVLGPVDLTLSAVGLYGQTKGGGGKANGWRDDSKAYAIGGLLGFGGLSFGVSWNDFKGPQDGGGGSGGEGKVLSGGLAYGFGPANVSVGIAQNWNDGADNSTVYAVSGDLGLLPGVTLKGDVSLNTEDQNKKAGGGSGPDSGTTYAGVMTVQLDY